MLSVGVQKDITEYKPKIIGQLTVRSLVCSIIAIAVSILFGAYCYFILGLGYDFAMFGIVFLSIPIWAAGFWHPYGMNLEKFIPLWLKYSFSNNVLLYKSSSYICGNSILSSARLMSDKNVNNFGYKTHKNYKMLSKRPDFEAYNPENLAHSDFIKRGINDYR